MMRKAWARKGSATAAALAVLTVGYVLGSGQSALRAEPSVVKVPGVSANQIPTETVGDAVPSAHTVYMDGSGKKNAAKNMNVLHEVMAAKGWTLLQIVPRMENGDLEGWWISYVAR